MTTDPCRRHHPPGHADVRHRRRHAVSSALRKGGSPVTRWRRLRMHRVRDVLGLHLGLCPCGRPRPPAGVALDRASADTSAASVCPGGTRLRPKPPEARVRRSPGQLRSVGRAGEHPHGYAAAHRPCRPRPALDRMLPSGGSRLTLGAIDISRCPASPRPPRPRRADRSGGAGRRRTTFRTPRARGPVRESWSFHRRLGHAPGP